MKNLRRLVLVVLMGSVLPIGGAIPDRRLFAEEKDKKVEVKKVPLSSIYSTSRQKGLKVVDQGVGDEAFPVEMRELYQAATRMGASNVFLVCADDIAGAVGATWKVFTGGSPVDTPVRHGRNVKSNSHWLVAYMGVAGSDPPEWLVRSAQVKANQVRLSYTEVGAETTDAHPYLVWIPLDNLEPGSYVVELYDEGGKHVTLSRQVKVPAH